MFFTAMIDIPANMDGSLLRRVLEEICPASPVALDWYYVLLPYRGKARTRVREHVAFLVEKKLIEKIIVRVLRRERECFRITERGIILLNRFQQKFR